jgi:hypothetical protein
MKKFSAKSSPSKPWINRVELTDDLLSGRGGLALFTRYLRALNLAEPLAGWFGDLRRSAKGRPVAEIFFQVFCFFLDGTSRHLVHFDRLREDPGYAAVVETRPQDLLSSHQVKRFFKAFALGKALLLRRLLRQLFWWRLKITKPAVVDLGLDTMVMDNDEALVREGVQPTYKKVKGFQPLQMTWGRFIIDAVFRSGDKHSNHGTAARDMIRTAVAGIRRHYRAEVPIVVRMDSGFFDQDLFAELDKLEVGYICGGKLYNDVTAFAAAAPARSWRPFRSGKVEWEYLEFGDRRGSWDRFRRAVFCRLVLDSSGQRRFEFARPDSVIYTNLGQGRTMDRQLQKAGLAARLTAESIVAEYHRRGRDELCHRGLKDFHPEELPFQRFAPNAAFYYTLLVAFFLAETFKEDVCAPVVPLTAYPTTLRRTVIDLAVKVVRHAGQIVLKVSRPAWSALRFQRLWKNSADPPALAWQ